MHRVETEIGGRVLSIETGEFAKQANGSVVVRYADTVILAAVTMGNEVKGACFLPLTVDYREMTYAAGKIPGGFFKREGRPKETEILTARLIDRAIRPLFPKDFIQDVLVSVIVLSSDQENDADVISIIGAATALLISDIPFETPVASCRVGRISGEFLINPRISQMEESELDIVIASIENGITMLEGGADEASEDIILKAIEKSEESIGKIMTIEKELRRAAGKEKKEGIRLPKIKEDFKSKVLNFVKPRLDEAFKEKDHMRRGVLVAAVKKEAEEKLGIDEDAKTLFDIVVEDRIKEIFVSKIKQDGMRLDGRAFDEIRPIECKVSVLPRTHGSGVFTRGSTQALATTTLGSAADMQIMDELEREYKKRFMLHYNFPSFATGEVSRPRGPGRREIGHGYLAEKALRPMLPPQEQFPYTIRVVSDILESNGSSSMASVCGGCLSLMDAGVPLKEPVAGIAMGVADIDGEKILLVDIAGEEDHLGNMDLKIAGTKNGITAIQMDLKMEHLDMETFSKALEMSRKARLKILEKMLEVIPEPKKKVSDYAPVIKVMKVDKSKIGAIIGPGGKTIKGITADTSCKINVDDDGVVTISGENREKLQEAVQMIDYLVGDVEVGKIYKGKVIKVVNFGAFVQIFPGKEGLVHISELAPYRVGAVTDIVQEGDEILVKVIELDNMNRIRLSRARALKELNITDEKKYRDKNSQSEF
ncbi:MAG: polyribonucleotide nucleotidyltransferase [Elusimicrobia bacterium]|nr:polyribonucleotide nucleotidyltransferase [Elusimicrobiota bacterium]